MSTADGTEPTMTADELSQLTAAAALLRRHGYHQDAKRIDSVINLQTHASPKYAEGFNYAVKLPLAPRKRFAAFFARSDWDDPAAAFAEMYPAGVHEAR